MHDENYRYCRDCGFPITDSTQKFCTNCGSALMDEGVSDKTAQMALPMKWYKFLIYFALFASAVLSFISGLDCLTGNLFSFFGTSANEAYAKYDGLNQLLMVSGIVSIAYACLLLATRFCLAKRMKIGPKILLAAYAVNIVINVVSEIVTAYLIASQTGQTLAQSGLSVMGLVIDTAVGIAVIVANKVYFEKRSALFVN